MLKLPNFWHEEEEATLLVRNQGFLERKGEEVYEIVKDWPQLVGISDEVEQPSWPNLDEVSEENQRIVLKDAERTFRGDAQRKTLQKVLTALIKDFNDYAQGMSYVTSFLLLTLDESVVASVITEMNANKKYIPGYWKHEAVGFGTDAHVFDELLSTHYPNVQEHLKKHFVLPETYCQKWFVGLNVHILHFESLFEFFEGFLRHGYTYLFQFGLSLIAHIKDELLRTKDVTKIYELLRLDTKHPFVSDDLISCIVRHTDKFASKVENVDFVELRKRVYENKLKARLEAARKSFEEAEVSDDDSDEDSDDEGGEECKICTEMAPEMFCKECKLPICGVCHEESKGPHKSSHSVEEDWDEIEKLTAAMAGAKI